MPVNQMDGIYDDFPQLAPQLSFNTVKDYDDWIARLHAMPNAFEQVTTNMSIGIEDGRVPPKYLLEKALEQVNKLAQQKPEDSPLALPLKKFPASIPAAEQERIKTEMLDAIEKEVLPAYMRFARFLEGELHSRRPHRARHRRTARRGKVLQVPDPPHHHDQSDRRPDSPDRPR